MGYEVMEETDKLVMSHSAEIAGPGSGMDGEMCDAAAAVPALLGRHLKGTSTRC